MYLNIKTVKDSNTHFFLFDFLNKSTLKEVWRIKSSPSKSTIRKKKASIKKHFCVQYSVVFHNIFFKVIILYIQN